MSFPYMYMCIEKPFYIIKIFVAPFIFALHLICFNVGYNDDAFFYFQSVKNASTIRYVHSYMSHAHHMYIHPLIHDTCSSHVHTPTHT